MAHFYDIYLELKDIPTQIVSQWNMENLPENHQVVAAGFPSWDTKIITNFDAGLFTSLLRTAIQRDSDRHVHYSSFTKGELDDILGPRPPLPGRLGKIESHPGYIKVEEEEYCRFGDEDMGEVCIELGLLTTSLYRGAELAVELKSTALHASVNDAEGVLCTASLIGSDGFLILHNPPEQPWSRELEVILLGVLDQLIDCTVAPAELAEHFGLADNPHLEFGHSPEGLMN